MNKKYLGITLAVVVIILIAVVAGFMFIDKDTNNDDSNVLNPGESVDVSGEVLEDVSGDLASGELPEGFKNVAVNVYDQSGDFLFESNLYTQEEYLFDLLKDYEEPLKLEYDEGEYGVYITSMAGVEEGNNFYWSYYVDGEYAQTSVSKCLVEDGAVYDFKIEALKN